MAFAAAAAAAEGGGGDEDEEEEDAPPLTAANIMLALRPLLHLTTAKPALPALSKALGLPVTTPSLSALATLVLAKPNPFAFIGRAAVKLVPREQPQQQPLATAQDSAPKGDSQARAAAVGPQKVATAFGIHKSTPTLDACGKAAETFVDTFCCTAADAGLDMGEGTLRTASLEDLNTPTCCTGYGPDISITVKLLDTRVQTPTPSVAAALSVGLTVVCVEEDAVTGLGNTLAAHLAATLVANLCKAVPRLTAGVQLHHWQTLTVAELRKLKDAGLPLTPGAGEDTTALFINHARAREVKVRATLQLTASTAMGPQSLLLAEVMPRLANAAAASAAREPGLMAAASVPVRGLARVVTAAPYSFIYFKLLALLAGGVALLRLDANIRTAINNSTFFTTSAPPADTDPFEPAAEALPGKRGRAAADASAAESDALEDSDGDSDAAPAPARAQAKAPRNQPQPKKKQKLERAVEKIKVDKGSMPLWACLRPSTTRFTSLSNTFSNKSFVACPFCGKASCKGDSCGEQYPPHAKQQPGQRYHLHLKIARDIIALYNKWCAKGERAAGAAT